MGKGKMSIGIYKITNKLDNKVYIGQSVNIEKRWGEHKRAVNYTDEHTYNYPLYRAIRKYGIENFIFEIVEECSTQMLTEREQYWMDYYNSKVPNGYNLEDASEPKKGEKCNFAILTDNQTDEIIRLLSETTVPMSEIGKMYNVSGACIEDINKGRRRTKDGIDYPIRKNAKSLGHSVSATSSLTAEDVMTIRQRYVNETLPEIYQDYKDKVSKSTFKGICYGSHWKHLPIYKKRDKKWVNYYTDN